MSRARDLSKLGNINTFAVDSTDTQVGIASTVPNATLDVGGDGVFTGIVTATSFSGSGANLTGIANTATIVSTATTTGLLNVTGTTDSTSSTTGSVTIAGGVGIAKNVYIGAGLSIAGTLTYEDVTNVDSVGMVTAKSGVNITGGQLQVGVAYSVGAAGVCTAAGFVGPLTGAVTGNADTATTATNATNSSHVLVTDNESTNEDNLITFVEDATSSTGNVGLEMDGNLTYNPSTGNLTATQLTGTVQTAAQTNITSLGSLSALTVTGDVTLDNGTNAGKDLTWDASADALIFNDDVYAKFGTDSDCRMEHDGSHFTITNTTGNFYLRPKGSEDGIVMTPDAGITIAYDNSTKFETTGSGTVTTGISTAKGAAFDCTVGPLKEKVNITAGKLSDNTAIDLYDGMVHYFTTQETTTSSPVIRYRNSTNTALNHVMSIGDCITVTVITTAAAAGYSANWAIDGNNVTEEWGGGSAPTAGGSDGLDIYSLTIIKTADATFTVVANLSNASN